MKGTSQHHQDIKAPFSSVWQYYLDVWISDFMQLKCHKGVKNSKGIRFNQSKKNPLDSSNLYALPTALLKVVCTTQRIKL